MEKERARQVLSAVLIVWLTILLSINFAKRKKSKTALHRDGKTTVRLRLKEITKISPDTKILRFALPSDDYVFGLPCGSHCMLQVFDEVKKENVMRPYTPISSDATDKGFVDFVVKVYYPTKEFPEGGKVTQLLDKVKEGEDVVEFFGPVGRKRYRGNGMFTIERLKSQGGGEEKRYAENVCMIAGGSGITPMLQICREMLRESTKFPKSISILYANKSEDDILCKDQLDKFESEFADRVKVWYTVDKAKASSSSWKYDTGFITKEMIEKHMPKSGPKTQILCCGPPAMMKFAVLPAFEQLGYDSTMYLTW
jgi:cytochrome-b5 reductase